MHLYWQGLEKDTIILLRQTLHNYVGMNLPLVVIIIQVWIITSSPSSARLIGTTCDSEVVVRIRMVNGVVQHGSVPLY